MIVAVPFNTCEWVCKNAEYNCTLCYVGPSKAIVRRAIIQDGKDPKEFVLCTDKPRSK